MKNEANKGQNVGKSLGQFLGWFHSWKHIPIIAKHRQLLENADVIRIWYLQLYKKYCK